MTTVSKFDLCAEALYDALSKAQYVMNKAQFAAILEIALGNVYNYLPSRDGKRLTAPLVPNASQVVAWINRIHASTHLRISMATEGREWRIDVTGDDRYGAPFAAVYACPVEVRFEEVVESPT